MLMRISARIEPGAQRLARSAPAQRPLPARRPSIRTHVHVLQAISSVIRPVNWENRFAPLWRPAARKALRAMVHSVPHGSALDTSGRLTKVVPTIKKEFVPVMPGGKPTSQAKIDELRASALSLCDRVDH